MAITTIDIGTPSGLNQYRNTDLDEVKAGITSASTVVHSITVDNGNAAEVFLKMWNVAVGSVTVGTTPAQAVIMIPASVTDFVVTFPKGWTFGTALTVAVVLLAIENDATDPGATAVDVTILYV